MKDKKKIIDTNLNSALYDACIAENADYNLIKDLLSKGADPLMPYNEYDDAVLEQLFCDASSFLADSISYLDRRIPELVDLFVKYGMDINRRPDLSEDDWVSPLWSMAFWCTPNAIKTLMILLESGLRAPELDEFLDHFLMDACYVTGDIDDDQYLEYLICGLKMIMLSASYENALSSSKYLQEVIETNSEENNYDLHDFRNYDDYYYEIGKTTCTNIKYGIANATIVIRSKASDQQVWKFVL